MRIIYDLFLQFDPDVKGKKPTASYAIAKDMDLEMYLVEGSRGPNTYAKAVIAVNRGNFIFKHKYDSGQVEGKVDKMANKCLIDILHFWKLEGFREMADFEYKRQTPIFRRLFNLKGRGITL